MAADVQERAGLAIENRPRRRAAHAARRPSPAFDRVTVTTDPRAALADWRALDAVAVASAYQSPSVLVPWIETEARAGAVTPMLVTAYDGRGTAVAFLPLGIRGAGPLRVAGFLGGKHVNYALGLFRPGLAWAAADLDALLGAAARAVPGGVDLYALLNQPHAWNGIANPFALKRHQPSPSSSHRTALLADPDAFMAQCHSAHARKALRQKRSRLERLGPVTHRVARSASEASAILDAHHAQKAPKLAAMGIEQNLDDPALRAFLEAIARPDATGGAALELHALACGDRIVATFAGLARGRHFSGLMLSHDREPDFARSSPGELLLATVIRMKCLDGFTGFDLGIGEARYKQTYCPVADPLFDTFAPVTVAGRLFLTQEAARLRLKGAIKRTPWAWSLARRLRRLSRRPRS